MGGGLWLHVQAFVPWKRKYLFSSWGGKKKKKDKKSRLFLSSDSFLNLCEQIAEVKRSTQLLSSREDLRFLCPTKPLFFIIIIIVRNDSVWGVAPRSDTHMNWQEADGVI